MPLSSLMSTKTMWSLYSNFKKLKSFPKERRTLKNDGWIAIILKNLQYINFSILFINSIIIYIYLILEISQSVRVKTFIKRETDNLKLKIV